MLTWAVYGMVFAGVVLMVFNIWGFIRFSRYIRQQKTWDSRNAILYIPIVLLIMFLLGYLAVGIFGKPDLIIAGILFFGAVFVFVMYKMLTGITRRIIESEKRQTEFMAAEEASRVKASFLASISHEMRTPMNVIMGIDNILLRKAGLDADTKEQLEKIGLSARHMLGLINNVLEMNNLMSGSLEVKENEFLLSDVLAQVSAITQTLCNEKEIDYQFIDDENTEGYFIGDEMMLRQALLSIMENAVKYTDRKGEIRFEVKSGSTEDFVRSISFAVKDNGIGIDPEFLPKVFEAFEQEDSSFTSRYGGTGLSLAVTKNVVELMGGTITVESEKNVGSTFTITVPLKFIRCSAKSLEAEEESEILEGYRILIVEDLPENAEIVQDLLELEGAETEHAENGQIAVDMFSGASPGYYDAILMDLRMPVMDGLEATRTIRALERPDAKEIPIIALTANAFESDVKASFAAGMNEHLAKPTDADELYATLRRYIKPHS